jgi:hypothetical protein
MASSRMTKQSDGIIAHHRAFVDGCPADWETLPIPEGLWLQIICLP